MTQNFSKYSDKVLIEMANGTDDEEFPFALSELADRNYSKTGELCILQLDRNIEFEKNIKSLGVTASILRILYFFNKELAILFFKENYTKIPIDAFGEFIENYTDTFYKKEKIDDNLILKIKKHLDALSQKELLIISDAYNEFTKAYK